MKLRFFSPTAFEVPKSMKKQTEVFGMGEKNAKKLAEKWNREAESDDFLIVYGCAGGLTTEHRAGEAFVISHLVGSEMREEILNPKLAKLKSAKLTTTHKIISTPDEKKELHRASSADLVDMEMSHLWTLSHTQVRGRLIFVRGVLDEVSDSLQFVHRPAEWLKPHTWVHATTILRRLRVYLRSMDEFLRDPRFWNELR